MPNTLTQSKRDLVDRSQRKRPRSSNGVRNLLQTSVDNVLAGKAYIGRYLEQKTAHQLPVVISNKLGPQVYQKKKKNDECYDRIFKSKFTIQEPEAEASTFNRFDRGPAQALPRPKSAQAEAGGKGPRRFEGLVSDAFAAQLDSNTPYQKSIPT